MSPWFAPTLTDFVPVPRGEAPGGRVVSGVEGESAFFLPGEGMGGQGVTPACSIVPPSSDGTDDLPPPLSSVRGSDETRIPPEGLNGQSGSVLSRFEDGREFHPARQHVRRQISLLDRWHRTQLHMQPGFRLACTRIVMPVCWGGAKGTSLPTSSIPNVKAVGAGPPPCYIPGNFYGG